MAADSAPVKKPNSEPKYIPAITTIAVTGLKKGRGAKINLPATDKAVITASNTILRVEDFFSKLRKNGTHARIITHNEIYVKLL